MSTETIRQPIEWWNQQLNLDWSKLLSVVARTALKTASGKFDDAWVEAARAFEAVGLSEKTKPQVLTWLLIHKALARSVFLMLGEARARNPELPFRVEGDGAAVVDAGWLMPEQIEVRRDFLTRPETLPFLDAVRNMLADWFLDLGVPAAEARALVGRLDGIFPRELREEWRDNASAWQPIEAWFKTPLDEAVRRQDAWDRAISKTRALPYESVFGDPFSLCDVYIPLRAYTVERRDDRGRDVDRKKPVARLGRLHEMLLSWINGAPDPSDALRVISGGPGSGKSSAARMLAAELAERPDLRVLYVPLHRLRIGGVLREGLADYCATWMFDDALDPVDALELQRRLVLFLDGLDELTSGEDQAAHDLANRFARELRIFLSELNRDTVRVLAIVGGRELAVQSTTEARFQQAPILHVFPFEKGDILGNAYVWHDDEGLLSLDQRPDWWQRFATATDSELAGLPPVVVDNPRLLSLTELPLLNYLVAGFARRHGTQITGHTSIADVYDALIRDVYERAWGRAERGPAARDLAPRVTSPDQFLEVLEQVALAVWHGRGRGADLDTIRAYLEAADLTGLIQEIRSKLEGGISNLLLTFFFRKDVDFHGHDYFEFTHKSFQEYLTARSILRAALNLATAGRRTRDIRSALVRWVETTGPSMITREIAEFLDREAERTFEAAARLPARKALCFLFGYQVAEGLPVEDARGPAGTSKDHEPTGFGEMRQWSDRAEVALLATIASLAGRASDPASCPVTLRLPDRTALKAILERLSLAEYRENGATPIVSVTAKSLRKLSPIVQSWDYGDATEKEQETEDYVAHFMLLVDLSGADLSGTSLQGADLSGANIEAADLTGADLSAAVLSTANLGSATLQDASLRGAHLHRAYLYRADACGADLRGADLHDSNLRNSSLRGSNLADTDLSGSNLRSADLRRVNLAGADLRSADLRGTRLRGAVLVHSDLRGADLRGANLADADLAHANLTGANLNGANVIQAKNLETARFSPGIRETLSLPLEATAILNSSTEL